MFGLVIGGYELQWHDWAWLGLLTVLALAGVVKLLLGLGGRKGG